MRKLSFVLIAALAIFFAGCNKQKSTSPSIADTSAKQTQPEAAAGTDQSTDQSVSNEQAQMPTQEQLGQDQATQAPDQSSASNSTAPSDGTAANDQNANAANNSSAQLDESQSSQAQIPGLPDSTQSSTESNAPADSTNNQNNAS